jgi:hypothetical protein
MDRQRKRGTVRIYKGQQYTLVDHKPHTCRDGRHITLEIWQSNCADCGAKFQTARPAHGTRFEFSRRCQRHKAPGRGVSPITHAAQAS